MCAQAEGEGHVCVCVCVCVCVFHHMLCVCKGWSVVSAQLYYLDLCSLVRDTHTPPPSVCHSLYGSLFLAQPHTHFCNCCGMNEKIPVFENQLDFFILISKLIFLLYYGFKKREEAEYTQKRTLGCASVSYYIFIKHSVITTSLIQLVHAEDMLLYSSSMMIFSPLKRIKE